jgi:hypothetical protein
LPLAFTGGHETVPLGPIAVNVVPATVTALPGELHPVPHTLLILPDE